MGKEGLMYCSGQNTNIVRHVRLFSDYVITIYVIIPRAIIATPSVRPTVRRTVRRKRPPDGPALRPNFTVRWTYVGHTPDIQRTNAGHIYGHRTQPRTQTRTVWTVLSCEYHIRDPT